MIYRYLNIHTHTRRWYDVYESIEVKRRFMSSFWKKKKKNEKRIYINVDDVFWTIAESFFWNLIDDRSLNYFLTAFSSSFFFWKKKWVYINVCWLIILRNRIQFHIEQVVHSTYVYHFRICNFFERYVWNV